MAIEQDHRNGRSFEQRIGDRESNISGGGGTHRDEVPGVGQAEWGDGGGRALDEGRAREESRALEEAGRKG